MDPTRAGKILKIAQRAGFLVACMYVPQLWVFWVDSSRNEQLGELLRIFLVMPAFPLLFLLQYLRFMGLHAVTLIWVMLGLTVAGGFCTAWWIGRRGGWRALVAGMLLLIGSTFSAIMGCREFVFLGGHF